MQVALTREDIEALPREVHVTDVYQVITHLTPFQAMFEFADKDVATHFRTWLETEGFSIFREYLDKQPKKKKK